MEKIPCVYILASRPYGTLYVGVTSDLIRRVWLHRAGKGCAFTARYAVRMLVWYEIHQSMHAAIEREKRMKEWKRKWKINRILEKNPHWHDLYDDVIRY